MDNFAKYVNSIQVPKAQLVASSDAKIHHL